MPPEVVEKEVADIIDERTPKADEKRITVVTPDNFNDYVEQQLGPAPARVEQEAEPEKKEAEAPAAKDEKPDKRGKKHELNERFSELTEARKAAEKKAEEEAARAKKLREERDQLERERNELKAKYEPPKTDELGPEPQPNQFTDIGEYQKAIKDWAAEKTKQDMAREASERSQREAAEKVASAWKSRQDEFKAKTEDYEKTIADSSVKVSNEVRDAILESDVGPAILYHLAKNEDFADNLSRMTVGKALKEVAKLELSLSGGTASAATKSAETPSVKISKAPEPIAPLKGGNAPAQPKVDSDGNFYGSYEEYKALRRSGKLR